MKILLISMPSIHVVRWLDNLSDAGHELYWFDILGKGALPSSHSVHTFTNWQKRKFPYVKGEFFLRQKFPKFYSILQPFLEVTISEKLEEIINDVQPDLVHSFEMQSCSYPILSTLQKYPHLKWLYSCWGSDLYRFKEQSSHVPRIKAILERINYLHTDCNRDYLLAKSLGFTGLHSGVIPGGGGFRLEQFLPFVQPISTRKLILVKGYHHHVGRGLHIVQALELIQNEVAINGYEVVVFGAHPIVINYIASKALPYRVYDRHALQHEALLQLMGKAILYVGNSISDGMPNTLLEAISMGAFPIQSNPGGVTAEIIDNGKNGFLIEDPNDIKALSVLLLRALQQPELIVEAFEINQELAKERLDYTTNQQKILALYQQIENEVCE